MKENKYQIIFDFSPFVRAVEQVGYHARNFITLRQARRKITTSYAPEPFKNCVDI